MKNIIILGGGSWGLAMANILSTRHKVRVWEFNPDSVQEIIKTGYNSKVLPNNKINPEIFISNSMSETFDIPMIDILILAVPSQFVRQTVISAKPYLSDKKIKSIVNLAKGFEQITHKRMSEVIIEELNDDLKSLVCTLSGPSHAEEVANSIPTTVVIASKNDSPAKFAQLNLSNPHFRIYTSNDICGVEIGGAVKNIISIAAGIIDGMGFGDNTKGALLTRGIAEIIRLGKALNADEKTFSGLSGIGDLITTAISPHSRNRYVGFELGKGKKLDDILHSMNMVAEGVNTTKAVWELKEKLNVSMPITDEIYKVLFFNKPPKQALTDLMTRELKDE